MSERTDSMTGTGKPACPARTTHRAFVAGWLSFWKEDVRRPPDVKSGRLPIADGRPLPLRPIPGKSQRLRRVQSPAACGRDAGSRMSQEHERR